MRMQLMYLNKHNNCKTIYYQIDNDSIIVRTYSCPSISCDKCSCSGHQPLYLFLSHFSFFFYHIQTLRTYNTLYILLLSILRSPNTKDINLLADSLPTRQSRQATMAGALSLSTKTPTTIGRLQTNSLTTFGFVAKSFYPRRKKCEVRDLNPRSRAWEARTLTRLG